MTGGLGADIDVPVASDDQLDAFVCALTARAHALGLTHPVPDDRADLAGREGWEAATQVFGVGGTLLFIGGTLVALFVVRRRRAAGSS